MLRVVITLHTVVLIRNSSKSLSIYIAGICPPFHYHPSPSFKSFEFIKVLLSTRDRSRSSNIDDLSTNITCTYGVTLALSCHLSSVNVLLCYGGTLLSKVIGWLMAFIWQPRALLCADINTQRTHKHVLVTDYTLIIFIVTHYTVSRRQKPVRLTCHYGMSAFIWCRHLIISFDTRYTNTCQAHNWIYNGRKVALAEKKQCGWAFSRWSYRRWIKNYNYFTNL